MTSVALIRAVLSVASEWRAGRPYRFPACCQAHYLLDVARGFDDSAVRRGGVDFGPGNEYVPCAICMRRPWRWRRPMTLCGPVEPARYATWVQACAELGIPEQVALSYGRPNNRGSRPLEPQED